MNDRITLVSDTEVRIRRYESCRETSTLRAYPAGEMDIFSNIAAHTWDAEGRAALRDCINCLDTGSFAALADTSAVPYVGKRMRIKDQPCAFRVLDVCGSHAFAAATEDNCRVNRAWWSHEYFLPLVEPAPAPKYRPYTPVEAAEFLGRCYLRKGEYAGVPLVTLSAHVVNPAAVNTGLHLTYEKFAEECTWLDGGTPCGVLVE